MPNAQTDWPEEESSSAEESTGESDPRDDSPEYILGARLLAATRGNVALCSDLIGLFEKKQGSIPRFNNLFSEGSRLSDFLWQLRGSEELDLCIGMLRKEWIQRGKTAVETLAMGLEEFTTSKTRRSVHESSTANLKYAEDPIHLVEGQWESLMEELVGLVTSYDEAEKTSVFYFPKITPHYIDLEGDVR